MRQTVWNSSLAIPVSPQRDHIRGPIDAPLTLLEYGDYECPYCGMAHPVVGLVRQALGDRLRFVFRHFPLMNMHPQAELAAEAAEAAGAQGKFWQMHDLLYENQDHLDPVSLGLYAQALGLDIDRFARDLQTHAFVPKVRDDMMSGVQSGIHGTPTFFVNGVRHDGSWEPQDLIAALNATAPAGVSP